MAGAIYYVPINKLSTQQIYLVLFPHHYYKCTTFSKGKKSIF